MSVCGLPGCVGETARCAKCGRSHPSLCSVANEAGWVCAHCRGPSRGERLEAAARELLERLPRCQHRTWDEQRAKDDACDEPATHVYINHAECTVVFLCEDHEAPYEIAAALPWADAASKVREALGGGGE